MTYNRNEISSKYMCIVNNICAKLFWISVSGSEDDTDRAILPKWLSFCSV